MCMEMVKDCSFSMEHIRDRLKRKTVHDQPPKEWISDRIEANNIRESTKRQLLVMLRELEASVLFIEWSDFISQNIMI